MGRFTGRPICFSFLRASTNVLKYRYRDGLEEIWLQSDLYRTDYSKKSSFSAAPTVCPHLLFKHKQVLGEGLCFWNIMESRRHR